MERFARLALVALSLVLIGAIGGLAYWSAAQFDERAGWAEHTNHVRLEIEALQASYSGTRFHWRSYLITNSAAAQASFREAAQALPRQIETLRGLTADNPDQQRRLARIGELLAADLRAMDGTVARKRAKESGERYQFYAPHINARVSEQVELEGRLRKAVEQRELFLHFQPKVELATRRIVGLEALMRWQGADGKLVSPARFVPVLEETGLILDAGRLAFELAAAAYRDWIRRGLSPPRIAVNVSALQMRRKTFVAEMFDAIGGDDGGVDLEITESLLMQDIDASIAKLGQLRDAGVGIALDDFGTGHSSLAYLSRLPLDTLKIDRSFVNGMTESAGDTSIVTAVISLAQALNLSVVAEGVETEEQARLLRLFRCDQMQGYLFSRPVTEAQIEALLRPPGGAKG